MVFGRTDEERIQINEETCWSGGPYSTTVAAASEALPEIRRLIFDGELIRAPRLARRAEEPGRGHAPRVTRRAVL